MGESPESVPLRSVAAPKGLIGGPFGSSLGKKDYVEAGVPVIRGQNLSGPGRFTADDFVFVTEEKAASELSRNIAEPGDVVFTQRGTLGQVGLVPAGPYRRYVISQSQMRLRVDASVANADYVYYCFLDADMQTLIQNRAIVTGVPHINLGILGDLPIPLPPLSEQRAIAEVLGALDDKIEANRRIREIATRLAASVLDDVLEQAEHNGSLTFERLGDIAGVNLRSVKPSGGQLTYLDIASVGDGDPGRPTTLLWENAPSRARRRVADGDTLWSTVRPNRRSHCLVLDPRDDLVVSTGFAVLTPESVGSSLLYGLTERDEFVDYLVSVADGSAYPAVRAERFSEARIPLPSPPLREFYEDITMPLRRLSAATLIEAEALAQLRDALLPKLLSGELRVGDAEPLVEEAV